MKRIAGISILSLILLLFLTRWIGQGVNRHAPGGGINKSMYVDINGSKQWISIYGQDKNNPVLLYLHGGPGASTSLYDYAFTRKWSDVYTVVTWDQRGCGKSYQKSHPEAITADVMMQDGKAMTEFLRVSGIPGVRISAPTWRLPTLNTMRPSSAQDSSSTGMKMSADCMRLQWYGRKTILKAARWWKNGVRPYSSIRIIH